MEAYCGCAGLISKLRSCGSTTEGTHRPSLAVDFSQAPVHLDPNYRAKPERLQHAIGKLLHLLTGEPFLRRKG